MRDKRLESPPCLRTRLSRRNSGDRGRWCSGSRSPCSWRCARSKGSTCGGATRRRSEPASHGHEHLSFVLAEYLRGSFAVADTALRQLAVHSRRIGGPDAPVAEWDGILAAARAAMPVGRTGSISVADAAGIIRQSTMKSLVGQSRREQHIFQRLSRPGPDELTMDAPFLVPRGEARATSCRSGAG